MLIQSISQVRPNKYKKIKSPTWLRLNLEGVNVITSNLKCDLIYHLKKNILVKIKMSNDLNVRYGKISKSRYTECKFLISNWFRYKYTCKWIIIIIIFLSDVSLFLLLFNN